MIQLITIFYCKQIIDTVLVDQYTIILNESFLTEIKKKTGDKKSKLKPIEIIETHGRIP